MVSLRSSINQKVLAYFFVDKGEEAHVNGLARGLGLDSGNLARQLIKLEAEGLLASRWMGSQRFYRLNTAFPLLKEYQGIVRRSFGIATDLKKVLSGLKSVRQAFLFGSYAKNSMDAHSDIDLFVVTDLSAVRVQEVIAPVQKNFGRDINMIVMGIDEFIKKEKKDPFVRRIFAGDRVILI